MALAMTSRTLTERSGVELAAAIRSGETSARDVVEAHIERAGAGQPADQRGRASSASTRRATRPTRPTRGSPAADDPGELPPLLGVPCTIKESIAFAGTAELRRAWWPAREYRAPSAPRPSRSALLDAGAIPLGLTNLSELTLWVETENRVYGRTRNAYDPSRTAGGSSGGEGAAIGSGGSPFGLGSDLGGSIRLPAFFNGVFGHKPSTGLVPLDGPVPGGGRGVGAPGRVRTRWPAGPRT